MRLRPKTDSLSFSFAVHWTLFGLTWWPLLFPITTPVVWFLDPRQHLDLVRYSYFRREHASFSPCISLFQVRQPTGTRVRQEESHSRSQIPRVFRSTRGKGKKKKRLLRFFYSFKFRAWSRLATSWMDSVNQLVNRNLFDDNVSGR